MTSPVGSGETVCTATVAVANLSMTMERFDNDETESEPPESGGRYEYGPDAQTDRDFESLTQKQKNAVETLVDLGVEATNDEVAADAGCTGSYVSYVEKNFPHIINHRRGTMQQVASDGGHQRFTFEWNDDKVWRAIRLLPDELSEDLFRQVREQ